MIKPFPLSEEEELFPLWKRGRGGFKNPSIKAELYYLYLAQ